MNAPLVSVLMTAYNREDYIADAIRSVLASTFTDLELIVVDDGSKDRTVEVARGFLSDPRVQVHINEKNLGDYPNRNRAAELARGKYLKYLDSDDLLYPDGLEKMVLGMEQFPEAALGLSRPASKDAPYPYLVSPEEAYREQFLARGLLTEPPSDCIIRADIFREVGGFNGLRFVGDMEMWLRIAREYPVLKLRDSLVWWRTHPGQEYHLGSSSLAYEYLNQQVLIAALNHELCPLNASDRARAKRRQNWLHARRIWRLALREFHLGSAIGLYRRSGLTVLELFKGLSSSQGRV